MKIVLTVHQFLPKHWAGTELITYGIAKELQRRGHEVVIVSGHPGSAELRDEERFDQYVYDGIPVHRFHHALVSMGGQDNVVEAEYDNRLFGRWFGAWLDRERPDIVHFMHLGRISSSAVTACADRGIRTVFTATDFWLTCPTSQLRLPDGSLCAGPLPHATNCLRHLAAISAAPAAVRTIVHRMPLPMLSVVSRVVRAAPIATGYPAYARALAARQSYLLERARLFDRIVVPSQIMAEILIRNGVPADAITLVPYGINLSGVPRRTDRGREAVLRIVFIGTLAEHKGAHVLLRAVRELHAETKLVLTLYGRTEEYPRYVRSLRTLAGDDSRIEFAGPFPNSRVGEVLDRADLLVCPSVWYENTPLVVLEAMGAGVPVVATDLPGLSETVEHGVNGLLFPIGDVDRLAKCLRLLAVDRGYLRRLAEKTVVPLSTSGHCDELLDLYRRVAADSRDPRAVGTYMQARGAGLLGERESPTSLAREH